MRKEKLLYFHVAFDDFEYCQMPFVFVVKFGGGERRVSAFL